MRGVDVADFFRGIYSCQLKSHKWWHTVVLLCFRHIPSQYVYNPQRNYVEEGYTSGCHEIYGFPNCNGKDISLKLDWEVEPNIGEHAHMKVDPCAYEKQITTEMCTI